MDLSPEGVPCGEGNGVWVRGHVFHICVLVWGGAVGKFTLEFIGDWRFMGLGSEFIRVLGVLHSGTALIGGLLWIGRTPLLFMAPSLDRDGGQGLGWLRSGLAVAGTSLNWWLGQSACLHPGMKWTSSWVPGLVASLRYWYQDLGVYTVNSGLQSAPD
ncbi:hypothetical protein CHARACLAT_033462 [Characodon lateralis]|uniref:Uncharacterized protein n=1 Tax=Characodon lateralis TaxID=208331 RepID=A0ABU7DP06_9TELE|nr:hypothetical protein [Characodon lateralis]